MSARCKIIKVYESSSCYSFCASLKFTGNLSSTTLQTFVELKSLASSVTKLKNSIYPLKIPTSKYEHIKKRTTKVHK